MKNDFFWDNNDYKNNIMLCSDNKGLVIELFHVNIYNFCKKGKNGHIL